MDSTYEHKLDKKSKPKKAKTKKRVGTFFNTIHTVGQHVINNTSEWWASSNQKPSQPDSSFDTPSFLLENNDLLLQIEANILNLSFTNQKNDLLRKRLFLLEEDYAGLYKEIKMRLAKFEIDMTQYNEKIAVGNESILIEKPKHVHAPSVQLSHDGLALMSYIYAKKDGSCKQPIVVKTFEGFEKIVIFVDDSPNDIAVSLIVQFDTGMGAFFGKDVHRIAIRLEKINSEIHAIFLDSVTASQTLGISTLKLNQFIRENALKNSKEKTPLHVYFHDFKNEIVRQKDKFQCTVFATKDARELNRNNESILNLNIKTSSKKDSQNSYPLPANYLKGLQSRADQTAALAKFGDEIVSRKGLTLKAVYLKHPKQSYIPHFSKKYETLVMECAEHLTDFELDMAINNYRAEEISAERLKLVYGNNNSSVKKA